MNIASIPALGLPGKRGVAAAFLILSTPLLAFTDLEPVPGTVATPLVGGMHEVQESQPFGQENAATAAMIVPEETVVAEAATTDDLTAAAEVVGDGVASYYGKRFAGRPTASGERFDPAQMTAAHRTLPFGSMVRVVDERTGNAVVVRINDRGPFHGGRVIDLSRAAAEEIGMVRAGKAEVRLELLAAS